MGVFVAMVFIVMIVHFFHMLFMKGFLDTSFGDKNPLTFTSNFMYEFSAEVTADQLGNTELKVASSSGRAALGAAKVELLERKTAAVAPRPAVVVDLNTPATLRS